MRTYCIFAAICALATSQALLLPEQYTQVGKKVMPATSSEMPMPGARIALFDVMDLRSVLPVIALV